MEQNNAKTQSVPQNFAANAFREEENAKTRSYGESCSFSTLRVFAPWRCIPPLLLQIHCFRFTVARSRISLPWLSVTVLRVTCCRGVPKYSKIFTYTFERTPARLLSLP